MARMDHSLCTHPKTTSARTACRKAGGPTATPDYVAEAMLKNRTSHAMKARMDRELPPGVVNGGLVEEIHCSECGNNSDGYGVDGYSSCCNEPLVSDCRPYADGGSCHHIVN